MTASASRRVVLALAAAACLALTACAQVTPVDQRGLVTLMAVDAAPESGYEVSVQVLYPPGLPPPGPSGQGGGQSNAPVFIRAATSPDFGSALAAVNRSIYLRLDFTHLQGIIVSEAVARDGLAPIFNYLARSVQFSINGWVAVARGESAADLLTDTEHDLPQPNEVLSQTMTWGRLNTPYWANRAFTLLKEMPLAGTDFETVGVASGASGGSPITTPFVLGGEALFHADRLVGWLDDAPALGLAVLTTHLQHQSATIPASAGSWQITLVGSKRRVRVTGTPTQPAVDISTKVFAHLTGSQGPVSRRPIDPQTVRLLQQQAAETLRAVMEQGLQLAQADGADAMGLGQYVRIHDPSYWDGARATWATEGFRRLPVHIDVQVSLTSVGDVFCPLLGPC